MQTILNWLMTGLGSFVNFLLTTISKIFPTGHIPVTMQTALVTVLNTGKQFSFIIPFETIFGIFLWVLGVEIIMAIAKITIQMIRTARG